MKRLTIAILLCAPTLAQAAPVMKCDDIKAMVRLFGKERVIETAASYPLTAEAKQFLARCLAKVK